MSGQIENLQQMLERISQAADEKARVSFGTIVESVGRRAFGPLLLLVGVILASPLSGMPGMPTTMGMLVLLISVQLLLKRESFWLPRWMLKRELEASKVRRAVRWLRSPSRFIDSLLRPRLQVFISGFSSYMISIVCATMALAMPMMELVPFSATGAGVALSAFGLALISHDGLLALAAFLVTTATFALVGWQFIGG